MNDPPTPVGVKMTEVIVIGRAGVKNSARVNNFNIVFFGDLPHNLIQPVNPRDLLKF
ncbi:MAG: hypothetical protein V1789_10160 [PVC group bacterium]